MPIWGGSKKRARSSRACAELPLCSNRVISLLQPGRPRILSVWSAVGCGRSDMTATRRLAAILAADVAGYSRLIGADEEGTLNRLRSIRAEIIDSLTTEHRGRIVKTTGDGLLV